MPGMNLRQVAIVRWVYLAWSVLKMFFAVVISPYLLFEFFVSKPNFLMALSWVWPHLDIFTPEGDLYLRRFFFWPKFKHGPNPRFLHFIRLSDEGRDPHDHPGPFKTTILWNGYDEEIYYPKKEYFPVSWGRPGTPVIRKARAGDTLRNPPGHTHAVKLIGPTLTWVVGWKKGKPWGFWIMDAKDPSKDRWVESEAYGEKGDERKSWTIDGK